MSDIDGVESNIIEIHSKEEFNSLIQGDKLTLVDFWAEWCGPCRMMMPVLHKIAENNGNIKLLTVNVDECNDIAGDPKFGVTSIPAIFFMKNGEILDGFVGALPESEVLKKMEGLL